MGLTVICKVMHRANAASALPVVIASLLSSSLSRPLSLFLSLSRCTDPNSLDVAARFHFLALLLSSTIDGLGVGEESVHTSRQKKAVATTNGANRLKQSRCEIRRAPVRAPADCKQYAQSTTPVVDESDSRRGAESADGPVYQQAPMSSHNCAPPLLLPKIILRRTQVHYQTIDTRFDETTKVGRCQVERTDRAQRQGRQ